MEVDRTHSEPIIEAALLLLAGGESRRMGRPKQLLPLAGTTLLEWQAQRLGPSFRRILVSAGELADIPVALREITVVDRRPGCGPLAGLEAGLAASAGLPVFALACDMPRFPPPLAARLLERAAGHDAAIPILGGRLEAASAAYLPSALEGVSRLLDRGERRLAAVLGELDVVAVREPELASFGAASFTNLNSPSDYQAFLDNEIELRRRR